MTCLLVDTPAPRGAGSFSFAMPSALDHRLRQASVAAARRKVRSRPGLSHSTSRRGRTAICALRPSVESNASRSAVWRRGTSRRGLGLIPALTSAGQSTFCSHGAEPVPARLFLCRRPRQSAEGPGRRLWCAGCRNSSKDCLRRDSGRAPNGMRSNMPDSITLLDYSRSSGENG